MHMLSCMHVFFCKQKTAYDLRISDWSSDVCSSDLAAANPRYRQHVLQWAPDIATHDPGSTGGVLVLDFHLTADGLRLIEINTNPGGLLFNAVLLDGVLSCAPAAWTPWTSVKRARHEAVAAWLDDARQQSRSEEHTSELQSPRH